MWQTPTGVVRVERQLPEDSALTFEQEGVSSFSTDHCFNPKPLGLGSGRMVHMSSSDARLDDREEGAGCRPGKAGTYLPFGLDQQTPRRYYSELHQ